jgi:hypothetical protein
MGIFLCTFLDANFYHRGEYLVNIFPFDKSRDYRSDATEGLPIFVAMMCFASNMIDNSELKIRLYGCLS